MKKSDVTVALLISVSLATCVPRVEVAPPSRPTTSVGDEVRTLVDLVNEHRRSRKCPALQWISAVADVASSHSEDMTRRNFFNHTNPEGLTPFQRLDRAGIKFTRAAENIAAGQATGQQVFNSWMGSSGHRRNIEDCALRQHGIGFARGQPSLPYGTVTNAWTHVLVTLE